MEEQKPEKDFLAGRITAEEFNQRKAELMKVHEKEADTTETIMIEGMHCHSCEKRINHSVSAMHGVKRCKADYVSGSAEIEFNPQKTSKEKIIEKIESLGYACNRKKEVSKAKYAAIAAGVFVALLGIYLVLKNTTGFELPEFGKNVSIGILFLAGLMTGFHCVAMCGGFMVSYSAKNAKEKKSGFMQHVYYGTGKTLSYAVIGGLFGLLGSFISFTPMLRGVIGILAGVFLVLFGLKMLDVIPALRKMQIRQPAFVDKINAHFGGHAGPFVTGLLNGLMIACGPLLAIYIYAAGTGSLLQGATSAAVFGLGTLPVLFGFGIVTSAISANATRKILKYSGIAVLILGVIMLNRGLSLTGSGYDYNSLTSGFSAKQAGNTASAASDIVVKDGYQEIRMDVLSSGWSPNKFVLKKGVPVKWIINGKQLNGCNNAIQVPKLDIDFRINPGLQTIEFTPTETGTISWSCWMGMIPGVFVVVDDGTDSVKALSEVPVPSGGSCGGGGGCGCGGGG
ncbi:MAG: sulfite exporter TauE/SafE family protein [Nanoarchaeota archaeon]|nr:sulfite exporter TauE/SafE family protein [Nanoarchaeota archaeon]